MGVESVAADRFLFAHFNVYAAGRKSRMSGMRVAMISMHTSPIAQPGSGDAGGMNV